MSTQEFEEKIASPCEHYYDVFTTEPDPIIKYQFLSPFELKDTLIELAQKKATELGWADILNAGRGNPNYYATLQRYAFSILHTICLAITDIGEGLGIMPEGNSQGLVDAFYTQLDKAAIDKSGKWLKKCVLEMERMCMDAGMSRNAFVQDLVISMLGCFYPNPSRVQNCVEPVLTEWLSDIIYTPKIPFKGRIKVFPTEGCTAAMIYTFNCLKYNNLVAEGDRIGVLTPIFTPYIELPFLKNYDLQMVCVEASETLGWDISDEELEKIKDPTMKAIFLVNPTNPTARSFTRSTVEKIADIIKNHNPRLIVLTDNVYAPFCDEFHDIFHTMPENCIAVYSLSKYYGVTGWRLGVAFVQDDNIIDKVLLPEQPASVHERYSIVSLDPAKIPFMDRMLMDSRQVVEGHTAGLSTPQQIMMCLFVMQDWMDQKKMVYNKKLKELLKYRIQICTNEFKYPYTPTSLDTNYYIVVDLLKGAEALTGDKAFADWLLNHKDPLEFCFKMAENHAVVCLPGLGFAAFPWTIRLSLANLATESYPIVGQAVKKTFDLYYSEFKKKSQD